jgi:hypothetical protein
LSATISVPGRERRSAPAQVLGVAALVGVDEHEIERPGQRRQRVERRPDDQLDRQPGEVAARHLRVVRRRLERHDPAAGRQRAGQPQGAVARQRADLQDRPGADQRGQQLEQRALRRRDLVRRQAAAIVAGSSPIRRPAM